MSEGPGLDWAPEPQPDEQAASDRGKETEEEVDSGCLEEKKCRWQQFRQIEGCATDAQQDMLVLIVRSISRLAKLNVLCCMCMMFGCVSKTVDCLTEVQLVACHSQVLLSLVQVTLALCLTALIEKPHQFPIILYIPHVNKGWNTLWYYVLSFVKQVSPLSQTRFNVNLQALHNTITSIKASELTLLWLTQ